MSEIYQESGKVGSNFLIIALIYVVLSATVGSLIYGSISALTRILYFDFVGFFLAGMFITFFYRHFCEPFAEIRNSKVALATILIASFFYFYLSKVAWSTAAMSSFVSDLTITSSTGRYQGRSLSLPLFNLEFLWSFLNPIKLFSFIDKIGLSSIAIFGFGASLGWIGTGIVWFIEFAILVILATVNGSDPYFESKNSYGSTKSFYFDSNNFELLDELEAGKYQGLNGYLDKELSIASQVKAKIYSANDEFDYIDILIITKAKDKSDEKFLQNKLKIPAQNLFIPKNQKSVTLVIVCLVCICLFFVALAFYSKMSFDINSKFVTQNY